MCMCEPAMVLRGSDNVYRWLEVGKVVLSEDHKCIIESNTHWLDDIPSQFLLQSQ